MLIICICCGNWNCIMALVNLALKKLISCLYIYINNFLSVCVCVCVFVCKIINEDARKRLQTEYMLEDVNEVASSLWVEFPQKVYGSRLTITMREEGATSADQCNNGTIVVTSGWDLSSSTFS
jgi:hypothetical protein